MPCGYLGIENTEHETHLSLAICILLKSDWLVFPQAIAPSLQSLLTGSDFNCSSLLKKDYNSHFCYAEKANSASFLYSIITLWLVHHRARKKKKCVKLWKTLQSRIKGPKMRLCQVGQRTSSAYSQVAELIRLFTWNNFDLVGLSCCWPLWRANAG